MKNLNAVAWLVNASEREILICSILPFSAALVCYRGRDWKCRHVSLFYSFSLVWKSIITKIASGRTYMANKIILWERVYVSWSGIMDWMFDTNIDESGLNNTFTKRAFFNGKLDLTEVEGLASWPLEDASNPSQFFKSGTPTLYRIDLVS